MTFSAGDLVSFDSESNQERAAESSWLGDEARGSRSCLTTFGAPAHVAVEALAASAPTNIIAVGRVQ
jgi:hypothetical protein